MNEELNPQIVWLKYKSGQCLTYEERMLALTMEEDMKKFNRNFIKEFIK